MRIEDESLPNNPQYFFLSINAPSAYDNNTYFHKSAKHVEKNKRNTNTDTDTNTHFDYCLNGNIQAKR